jgi:hypothetical protein
VEIRKVSIWKKEACLNRSIKYNVLEQEACKDHMNNVKQVLNTEQAIKNNAEADYSQQKQIT